MHFYISLLFLIFSVLQVVPATAQKALYTDDDLLRYAKSIDVSKMDPTLHSQPLKDWFLNGPAKVDEVIWSVSRSCDLKVPMKDAEGKYPLCVRLGFRRGNVGGVAMLRVGTLEQGIIGSPTFQYIEVGALFLDRKRERPITLAELPDVLDDMPQFGTVCILPNSSERPVRTSPGGDYNPATLKLRIDKQEPIPWPHQKSIKLENLSLRNRHLVVLTSDEKQIQSFRFDFEDYADAKLCMSFDGYQGVQLASKKTALCCSCK